MATCSICANPILLAEETTMQSCASCARQVGLIPIPPLTRPPLPCTRCNHQVFVRAIPREHSSVRGGESNAQVSVPMFLTHTPSRHEGWIFSTTEELAIEKGHGLLEMFICQRCGFVEWYCPTVQQIPIHPNMMTELVDYTAKAPYR